MSSYQKFSGNIRALPDDILVKNMEQGERITKAGIIITDDNTVHKESGVRPRWAEVYKIGRNVDIAFPGQWILIDHGRWTYGVNFTDETGEEIYLQKVDTKDILLVSNDPPSNEAPV